MNAPRPAILLFLRSLIVALMFGGAVASVQSADSNTTPSTIYVKTAATGSNDGTSWANAYTRLQDALAVAASGDQIWIASGTYKPSTTGDRTQSFNVSLGVGLYGGFVGTEASLADRTSAAAATILSGDLLGNDNGNLGRTEPTRLDNTYNVVRVSGASATVTFDSLTIQSGHSETYNDTYDRGGGIHFLTNTAGNVVINKCILRWNTARSGSGWYVDSPHSFTVSSSLLLQNQSERAGAAVVTDSYAIQNCAFVQNRSENSRDGYQWGGGLFIADGTGSVINCVFASNYAAESGGAIFHNSGNTDVINCTFFGNSAGVSGQTLLNYNSLNFRISNSVIWGSSGGGTVIGNDNYNFGGTYTQVRNSLVQGGYSGSGTVNVISGDPLFTNSASPLGADGLIGTADDGLRLGTGSPAINAGNNTYVPAGTTTDIAGAARVNGTVDMGAYETAPIITSQPQSITVSKNAPASFSVAATGNGTLTYQWQKDGVDIPGATSSSFVVSNAQSSNVGFYRCVVTDNFGDAFSNEASLRIFGLPLFRVMQNTLHWQQAKADAVSNGGRLAVVATQEKIDHLNAWLQSINNSRYLWIGLTDEDSEGSWKWIDGTPLGVSNWASGEPNNNGSGEDYAHVLGVSDQFRWNDLPTDWWIYTPGGYILEVLATPVITTPTATSITATGATLGGNVTSDGGAAITERGVVYSATATNNDPLIGGAGVTKVTAAGTTGVFTAPVTGLTQGTGYSFKAYAINSQGTTYTSVVTFTSLSTNADLSALTLSAGTLDPTFASGTTAYTASVSNATTPITVTPTRAQGNATIEVRVNTGTYAAVTSGSPSASLPLNVGTNTLDVRVTAQDGVTRETYSVTVTRDKAAQTITFANPGAQLANATVNLSAEGGASGEDVTFTVEGPATLVGNVLSFTGAGSVTVRANQDGNDLYHPAPEVAQTFTVTKATATVTLGSLSQTYDGTPKSAAATTDPAGKTVVFAYEGSSTAPTNAGSYAVVGTIDDPIYQGSATGTLTIAKAAQSITFGAIPDKLTTDTVTLTATGGDSGNPVTFAVTAGPASITSGVLGFTGAGSVTITASQAGNANYEAATAVARTFTITKATATVTLANLSQTYDGTPKSATATTDPAGKTVALTYDDSPTPPTDAGFYIVTGTVDDPIYQGSASRILVIAKAAQIIAFAAIPEKLTTDTITLTATGGGSGNPVNFAVTGGPASITDGILSFTGAGSVTITASQAGNANYEAATSVSRTFTVTKATATVTLGNLSQTYDGTPKFATATTDPVGKTVTFTYDGEATAPTNAGSYEVVGTIDDPIYQGSANGTLEIAKATQTITFASIPNKLTTDTVNLSATGGGSGNPVTFAVTEGPASITNGVLSFTGAGNVTVTASQAGNANYEAATSVSRTFTVTKANATVTLANLSQTYDGTPKSATATTDPVGKTVNFTYDGSAIAPTNAGNYAVVGTIDDPIYQGSATGTLQIAKASQVITFAAIPDKLTTDTVTLSATGGASGNPVTFAVTEGPASITNGVLSFSGAGNVTITASQAGNTNYETATPVSRTFTVTKATATVTLGNLSQTYDGTPKAVTATTDPAGKTVTFTYEGSATAPTNAGSYAVVATIDDPIYQGSAMGTLEIAKAAQSITFAAIPDKLTTDTVTLSATGGGSGNAVTFAVTEGPATISNGVLSFTGSGSVTITASQAGNANYETATSVSRTFTVTKATATVTLGNLSQTYDGTPKSATATTDPVGKTVTFTYDGTSTPPTNAGSYEVVGTIDDAIHQGSANGTLTIAKAAQTITFANPGPQLANATVTLSATGGGSGNPVTFAVTSGPASISNGVLSFTGPGNVTITVSQAGNANYEDAVEVSHTFTVSKAPATLTLSRLHQVADGTAREVVVTTVPEDLEIEVTYDGAANAPIAPGSYAVVATSADDRYEGSASGTLVVDDPARSVRVPGGGLPALSALGELTVPTFSIGAYEVTGSQWAAVVAWAEAEAGYDFDGAGAAASGDRPVTGINWFDAAKWCNARTEWENNLLGRTVAPAYQVAGAVYRTGTPASPADLTCDFSAGGYRLPTAAEWEFAARGGASGVPSTYPGGNTLDDLGWYIANSNGATQPAGGKTANGLGLYDLAGNAAEWTWDAPAGSPAQRLLRGGAWSSTASACELNALSGETPALRLDRAGFRLARSIFLALAAALDDPNLDWESGGDEAWFAETGTTHDGTDAAESGAVAPGQSSWLETTVTGPCNLRFRWEASQRAALDVFRLETGAGDPILLTGPANWAERLVELPAGDHTLRWVFARDAASTGTSRVRLDAVSVTTATVPTVTTAAASNVSGSGATLGGEVTADGGRTVTARGVVYSTTPEPTVPSPGALAAATSGTGTFSVAASGLTEGVTYFARAYATNNLGTSYGAEIVLTTDTNVVFVEGLAILERGIRSGDTHRFRFTLGGPRVFSYGTTGAGGLEVSLHDGAGALLKSHASPWDLDEDVVLEPGTYELRVRRPAGGTSATQPFTLTLDERTVAVVRPDAMVGSSLAFLGGANVYTGPLAQQLRLTSPKARAVTAYAAVANRGNRPDRIAWRGNGDTRHFRVDYRNESGARVSGAVRSGLYRTAERQPGAPPAWLRILVTPERRLLVVSQRGRTVTLRKVHTVLLDARSVVDPSVRDGVSIRVETR